MGPSGNCDDADAIYLGSTSPIQYTFDTEGAYTFACDVGMGAHCRLGQIINVTVTGSSSALSSTETDEKNSGDEAVSNGEEVRKDEEENKFPPPVNIVADRDEEEEEEEEAILKQYKDYFNPGEEMKMIELRIQPYKIPHKITTYVDFQFNLPEDMQEIVHIVAGDVIVSQPKHLHHFVLTGCTESIDPSAEGLPTKPGQCSIPIGGWAVGGGLFSNIPSNAGRVFGPGLGIKALSLNVHYTDGLDVDFSNSKTANDGVHAIATDGIRILYTPKLRPQTVLNKQLLTIGLPQPQTMNLPPQIPRFFYTKTCTLESSCRDTADAMMNQFGKQTGLPGGENLTCGRAKAFCFMDSKFTAYLQMACPVSCGLCGSDVDSEGSNPTEYHVNGINYHAHLTGREMYATLLPKMSDDIVSPAIEDLNNNQLAIDLESKDLWMYDNQVSYPLVDAASGEAYMTVRPGDKIQVTCVYDSTLRTETTFFGLSTYDEMCITSVSILTDTPNTTIAGDRGGEISLVAAIFMKSFACAVDDTSHIWRGILEIDEDARQIWKAHRMNESDCTYPVGTIRGDTAPTGDANCISADANNDGGTADQRLEVTNICFDAAAELGTASAVIFNGDATAGEYCDGGSMNGRDSNAEDEDEEGTASNFQEYCISGGGVYQPYTCQDAEDSLKGGEMIFVESEIKEYRRKYWWQPKCCSTTIFVNVGEEEIDEPYKEEATSGASLVDLTSLLLLSFFVFIGF